MSIREMLNRHLDETPVECASCGWRGKLGDCKHRIAPIPFANGDTEIVSRCPDCSSEDLRELNMLGAVV